MHVSYPPKMTAFKLFAYVKSMHSNEDDLYVGDLGDRIYAFKSYKLREIALERISSPWSTDYATVSKLAKSAESFPPIVLADSLEVIDGSHRVKAAIHRGDKTILAYVGEKS